MLPARNRHACATRRALSPLAGIGVIDLISFATGRTGDRNLHVPSFAGSAIRYAATSLATSPLSDMASYFCNTRRAIDTQ
jgi:hypothetical protein